MPSDHPPALALAIDPAALEALIEAVVERTIARLDEARAKLPDNKLAYSESEAAEMLGLHVHQLRDARHRGEINASVVTCGRIRYTREDLIAYLAGRRWTPETQRKPTRGNHANGAAH